MSVRLSLQTCIQILQARLEESWTSFDLGMEGQPLNDVTIAAFEIVKALSICSSQYQSKTDCFLPSLSLKVHLE